MVIDRFGRRVSSTFRRDKNHVFRDSLVEDNRKVTVIVSRRPYSYCYECVCVCVCRRQLATAASTTVATAARVRRRERYSARPVDTGAGGHRTTGSRFGCRRLGGPRPAHRARRRPESPPSPPPTTTIAAAHDRPTDGRNAARRAGGE